MGILKENSRIKLLRGLLKEQQMEAPEPLNSVVYGENQYLVFHCKYCGVPQKRKIVVDIVSCGDCQRENRAKRERELRKERRKVEYLTRKGRSDSLCS